MPRVTIKDIAERVGVSAMTVSNVINNKHKKVSAETVERINEVIKELNYKPDFSARSLVSKRSKMIGVIIPQTEEKNQYLLENPFYSEIVSAVENVFRKNGYYMMLIGVDKDQMQLESLSNWNLEALILLGFYEEGLYAQIKTVSVPVLLIDSYIEDHKYHHLRTDDEKGSRMAVEYLIEMGHKNIALVSGQLKDNGVSRKRYSGYVKALEEHGIRVNQDLVFSGSVSYDWGLEAARLIQKNEEITAVFCTADMIAAGLTAGLHELKVSIPEDISIMGFDNLSISKMIYPTLTTVDQGVFAKGVSAAESVLEILENGSDSVAKIQHTHVSIVERNSVQKLNE